MEILFFDIVYNGSVIKYINYNNDVYIYSNWSKIKRKS